MNIYSPQLPLFKRYKCLFGSVIVLEGNIGVGKTTAGASMVIYLNSIGLRAKFFPEPVCLPLLNQYQKNMKKYAYSFQIIMAKERIQIYKDAWKFAKKGGISIIDRSLMGDYTFALMQYEKGFFTDSEWNVYLKLLEHDRKFDPDFILYLECTPEKAYERMIDRGRPGEKEGYTLEYFQDLNEAYEKSLNTISGNIGRLNWNDDLKVKIKLSTSSELNLINSKTNLSIQRLSDEVCQKFLDLIKQNLTS